MTITREQIVAKAREYLGTPFHHQGRVKKAGIDCIGLLVGVAKELGVFHYDRTDYPRLPDGKSLMAELRKVLDEIKIEEARPGDVLVFWFSRSTRHPQHVGIKTDLGVIHTYEKCRRVVEGPAGKWTKNITHAFRFRGVK